MFFNTYKHTDIPLDKHELAVRDLKTLIAGSLTSKLDELKNSLNAKLVAQEEIFNQKLKKMEEEEKKKDVKKPAKK